MKKNLQLKNFLLLFVFVHIQIAAHSQSQSEGPLNPGRVYEPTFACLACPGTDWYNTANAMLPDSIYAATQLYGFPQCFQTSCYYSRALEAQEFGFTIPLTATITGIKVDILRRGSSMNAISDSTLKISVNLLTNGINHAGASAWPVVPAYTSYGDSADLWGMPFTPAIINTTTFGISLKVMNRLPAISSAFVDHIQMTVYYTMPTGITEHQTSSATVYFSGENIFVKFASPASENTRLMIYDFTGRLLTTKNIAADATEIIVDVSGYTAGFYFVKVTDASPAGREVRSELKKIFVGR
jgi:hypothetical protein